MKKADYRIQGTQNDRLEPSVSKQNWFWKILTESWDIGKNVSGLFRDFCYKQQNETTKNENGAQKNLHNFNVMYLHLMKLGVGLDHMYTKGWIFF